MESLLNGPEIAQNIGPEMRSALTRLQPLCAALMAKPTEENLQRVVTTASSAPRTAVQEMQLYLLYPIIQNLKSSELRNKAEVQCMLINGMRAMLNMMVITSVDHFIRYHTPLLFLVFDKQQPGMVADVPEELKLSVMETVTTLVLRLTDDARAKLYRSQHTPLLAQAIYVSVQIAKLEKLRSLKLSAITCVLALTGTHPSLLDENYQPRSHILSVAATDVVSGILPGIVGGLQDIAVSSENQGHIVTARAVNAIHRVLCLVMNDRNAEKLADVTNADFAKIFSASKNNSTANSVTEKNETNAKRMKTSPEYFQMAGCKLKLVTQSLVSLLTHEHVIVRRELAIFCGRMLIECARTMGPSMPYILDTLIVLSEDDYPEVSQHCINTMEVYFHDTFRDTREKTLEVLADNFYSILVTMPRLMNNIDSRRKQCVLNLLRGYLFVLSNDCKPQKLTTLLSCTHTLATLCTSLVEAARLDSAGVSLLLEASIGDISTRVPKGSPWVNLVHVDDSKTEEKLKRVCRQLGKAECADIVVDSLLDMFNEGTDRSEVIYLLNNIIEEADISVERILNVYIAPEVWDVPLQVGSSQPLTSADTLDVSVYNPVAWEKESVPDLYEGTVETRYIDISLQEPRAPPPRDPTRCRTLREAKDNMVLSCLLTEGVGVVARRLRDKFQPYLLRTLCLLLERVGSKYEMLRCAGMKALNDVTIACGHSDITQLVRHNADYFTYQVTKRLKKEWNCVSALHILNVVLQHCDASILDCLQGLITDVLLQSCDRYHQNDATAYLQVFLTFIMRIRKWFPKTTKTTTESENIEENLICCSTDKRDIENRLSQLNTEENGAKTESQTNQILVDTCSRIGRKCDILEDTLEYIRNVKECERLLNRSEFEMETGKTTEEMFKEDQQKNEEDSMDYEDENVTVKPPLPQHIAMVSTILKRCVHLVPARRQDEKVLALQVLEQGLPALEDYEDELLPLCHLIWNPLIVRFSEVKQPIVQLRSFHLLVTMAHLAKDFMKNRSVKEVLPLLCKFLVKQSEESLLKDLGSAYRVSQVYQLQGQVLERLAQLTVDLGLQDTALQDVLSAATPYLSNKQPKALQLQAVNLFRRMLEYDLGATWHHLRHVCKNELVSEPPTLACKKITLEPVVGQPSHPVDKCYKNNVNAIFGD